MTLPDWARNLVSLYESGAASQFILYGNVHDRFLIPQEGKPELGDLADFLLKALLPKFDVVLNFDLGNGLRVEKGGARFAEWPRMKDNPALPRPPFPAVETITHYLRYVANLARLKGAATQAAVLVRDVQLIAPVFEGLSHELGALASLVRGWTTEEILQSYPVATFLVADNLSDVHPLIARNPRAARVEVPLPRPEDLGSALALWSPAYGKALNGSNPALMAAGLSGATLRSVENLVKVQEHAGQKLSEGNIRELKKSLVEKDAEGLIEFLSPTRTLDDLHGVEKVKEWFRKDLALWAKNDVQALPKGYLFCGPVGTGKTFFVECLAGEAGVPVVKLKNFRDRWVGSSEGNLERIFRFLKALGRCYVFIDEADQALGKRESGEGDSGLSGRLYSMIAEEMGKNENRGRIIWVLASSRPDLIEVDLKRPGRVDVKIPLFPTTTPEESFQLLRMLCRRRGLDIPEPALKDLAPVLPILLTPGAAETIAVKTYRAAQTENISAVQALKICLDHYQDPVPKDVMEFQIRLAIREASDRSFVPPALLAPFGQ